MVDVAKLIKPSARGEQEITTVNQEFLKDGALKVQVFGRGSAWIDTGTLDSLAEAYTFVEIIAKRQGSRLLALKVLHTAMGGLVKNKSENWPTPC